MLLKEMFSPLGGPKEVEQDIDWLDDLKFFIDNNSDLLTHNIFPAIEKHKKYVGHPKAFTIYMKPLEGCVREYCETFDVQEGNEIFTKEKLIELAKVIAEEQERFIKEGDYDK